MRSGMMRAFGMGAILALVVSSTPARADLLALGHEFRPTLAERQPADSCVGEDGVTATIRRACFRDGVEVWGSCDWDLTAVAEWYDREGNLVAGPYRIGKTARYVQLACIGNAILTVYEAAPYVRQFRTIRRNGVRSEAQYLCGEDGCENYYIRLVPMKDRFFVMWIDYGNGIRGRYISSSGTVQGDVVAIAEWGHLPGLEQTAVQADAEDRLLIAWSLRDNQRNTQRVFATLLEGVDTTEPVIQASEFPHLDYGLLEVTSRGPGQFVVAWENPLQAGWVARRVVSGDAVPTSTTTTTTLPSGVPEFVSTSVLAEPSTGEYGKPSFLPTLAGDASGTWLAAWRDRIGVSRQGYTEYGSVFSSSADNARRWTDSAPVEDTNRPPAKEVRIATDQRGKWIMAWRQSESGSILWRRSDSGGKNWRDGGELYSPASDETYPQNLSSEELDLAAGRDGVWVATWINRVWRLYPSELSGNPDSALFCLVRVAVSADSGSTWKAPRTIGGSWCSEVDRGLQVASDRSGNWKVVWSTDHVYVTQSTNNARTWSTPRIIALDLEDSAYDLDLGSDGFGHWLLAFTASHLDPSGEYRPRVFLTRGSSWNAAWTRPIGIAPWHDEEGGLDDSPSVAAGGNGVWAVAWRTHTDMGGNGLDGDIAASFSDDDGEDWSAPRPVDDEARGDARDDDSPGLVHAGANTWGVVWQASESVSAYDDWHGSIRFARTNGDCGNGRLDVAEECDDFNNADGDGCDGNCLVTACGNIVVTKGEECDDGNTDDDDDCLSDCRLAICGDGAKHAQLEGCDDGNDNDFDACTNACTLAICGDQIVREGVEACDEGQDLDNNDDCLTNCSLARCGDGYLRLGTEECDDGNAANGDSCTRRCTREGPCSSSALLTTASDALRVLRKAVGLHTRCAMWVCDSDGDGRISATDALQALRLAVGLVVATDCSGPHSLLVRVGASERIGALQFRLSYLDAAGDIPSLDGEPACTILPTSVLAAMNLRPNLGDLTVGIITSEGFQGPLDLVRCSYDAHGGPSANDFRIIVEDVTDVKGVTLDPMPQLELIAE